MQNQVLDRMQFIDKIRKRQNKLKGKLDFLNHNLSVITKCKGKTLSQGCQCCKDGTWFCLYVGHKCNLDCWYCPQGNLQYKEEKIDHSKAMQRLWMDDIKTSIDMVKPGTIKGVSYSGGEPFLYLDKIIDMASYITRNHPDIYQWCYTNGLLVTVNKLQILKDIGIKEIRFHIEASNFNKKVIEMIKEAIKIIDIVTIETPATPRLKKWLIDKKNIHMLEEIGLYQLNLSEIYYVGEYMYEDVERYIYTSMSRGQHVSPTYSREVTYDIFDYVIENNINIICNDCSHQSRDAQLITRELNKDRLTQMW
jgi:uncharacterized protein